MNNIRIEGILSNIEYSHETHNEKFYKAELTSERNSEAKDVLQVIIPENLLPSDFHKRITVSIKGQIRSRNAEIDGKNSLLLYVFVQEIVGVIKSPEYPDKDINEVVLEGYVVKKPVIRKTPKGRDVADILIAVNRPTKRSDYIPVIVWGRNAKFADTLETGFAIKVEGRFQSRNYIKKVGDKEVTKTAYELSAGFIKLLEREED